MAYIVPNPRVETISFRCLTDERHQAERAASGLAAGTLSELFRLMIANLPTIQPILTESTKPNSATDN